MNQHEDGFPLREAKTSPGREAPPPDSSSRMPALHIVFPDAAAEITSGFDQLSALIESTGKAHNANLTLVHGEVKTLGASIKAAFDMLDNEVKISRHNEETLAKNLELLADATWDPGTRPKGWGKLFTTMGTSDTIPSPPP